MNKLETQKRAKELKQLVVAIKTAGTLDAASALELWDSLNEIEEGAYRALSLMLLGLIYTELKKT